MGVNSTEVEKKKPDDGNWALPKLKRWEEKDRVSLRTRTEW